MLDLGCGGGQWLSRLHKQGYQTCGIDVSPSMLKIARRNSPGSTLIEGSFSEVDLPPCAAATCLGEPLNYLGQGHGIKRVLRNVFAALEPGGLFVFDVRHPPVKPQPTIHHSRSAEDWFCFARIEEDQNRLVRHITTFARQRGGCFRRAEETHLLKLFSRAQMIKWLREVGFRVRTRRSYGEYQLGKRQSVFLCRKPKGAHS